MSLQPSHCYHVLPLQPTTIVSMAAAVSNIVTETEMYAKKSSTIVVKISQWLQSRLKWLRKNRYCLLINHDGDGGAADVVRQISAEAISSSIFLSKVNPSSYRLLLLCLSILVVWLIGVWFVVVKNLHQWLAK